MRSIVTRTMAAIVPLAMAACSGSALVPSSPNGATAPNAARSIAANTAATALSPANGYIPFARPNAVRALCPRGMGIHHIRCFALMRTDIPTTLQPNAVSSRYGYGPADLQSAYALPSKTAGKGQTVALIESFGYKSLANDLKIYRSAYGLPPCTIANGCLKIVNQAGQTKPLPPQPPAYDDWRGEQALDMDMVSAVCPNCKILVVQANNEDGLYPKAVETAARLGADVVSNSYGAPEYEASDPAFSATGRIYVASAGDYGGNNCGVPSDCQASGYAPAAAEQPASLANVVAAGGTTLTRGGGARGWTETVWNTLAENSCYGNCGATGSGCSRLVAKPAWQHDTGCGKRAEADASAVASVNTPVAVYSAPEGGWGSIGGTSASAPILAGVFALAGNATKLHAAQSIWKHGGTAAFNDVAVGSNVLGTKDKCFSKVAYICHARKGYDGPTGWGTPHGVGAF